MWYLIFAIIVLFILFNSKKSSDIKEETHDVGMYFMDLEKNVQTSEHSNTIKQFYYLLGCASQGRIDEINQIYKEAKQDDEVFFELAKKMKPQIMKMAKIAKQVDDTNISNDMKNGESIGEYQSRKLMKRKAFMDEFNYFKKLDLNEYLKTI